MTTIETTQGMQVEKPAAPVWSRIAKAGGIALGASLLVNMLLRTAAAALSGAPAGGFGWVSVLGWTIAAVAAATLIFGWLAHRAANPRRTFTMLALITLLISFVPIGLSFTRWNIFGGGNFRGRYGMMNGTQSPLSESANGNPGSALGPNGNANGGRRSSFGLAARLPMQGAQLVMNLATCGITTVLLLGTLSRADEKAGEGTA